jgi:rod shape determining protein RodA
VKESAFLKAAKVKNLWRNLNWSLVVACTALILYGLLVLYSASSYESGRAAFWWQLGFIFVGIILASVMAYVDYHFWLKLAYPFYFVALILLVVVLIMGKEVFGAQRWLYIGPFPLQPSELAKIAVVLILVKEIGTRREKDTKFLRFLRPLALVLLPALLTFEQPDLGTSIVLLFIFFPMAYFGEIRLGYVLGFLGTILASSPLLWRLLRDYQRNRFLVLFNPDVDPLGIGYNLRQSLVTIGSGGILGKGYLEGTQKQLQFLPVRHTDFIFAVLAEELGFWGVTLLLALYGLLIYLILRVAQEAEDDYGRLIAIGMVSLWLCHIFVNIGMTVGIMPVTGIWLPFFSYGGNNVLVNFFAIGLIFSVALHKRKFLFYPQK